MSCLIRGSSVVGRGVLKQFAVAAACVAAMVLGSANADAQTAAPVKIRVSGADAASSATPFFVAERRGFFKEAGLDVSYIVMGGTGNAREAALRTGDLDIGIGAAAMWMADIATGIVSGKIVGEFADNNYVILGTNGVTNMGQLKGKVFGISAYNAGDQLYAEAVLSHYGISPNDVTWLPIGIPASRLAALQTAKVDAVEMLITALPESAKSKIILTADDSPVPFVSNALFANQQILTSNHDAVQKFLAAISKGADWLRAHPDEAVTDCMDSNTREADCKTAIDIGTKTKNPFTWSSTGRVNTKAIEAMIPIVVETVPKAKGMTVSDFVDTSIAGSGK